MSLYTLEELRKGHYDGLKKLKLSCELQEFPLEILRLHETLEVLDLSGNMLCTLPDEISQLRQLRIFFCSDNQFVEFPKVLHHLPKLEMVAFKNNRMQLIPEDSLPASLRWLILTNNQIRSIPKSIQKCHRLQKLMLAGNLLVDIPLEMALLKNLALLRLSVNRLESLPDWLLTMPNLSFLCFAGNPCCISRQPIRDLPAYAWDACVIGKTLGEGASGTIYQASCRSYVEEEDVAIKLFKGSVTSDGSPADELLACINAGSHTNLISTIGRLTGHPQGTSGLVLQLVPPSYRILGLPPSLESCTRDCYPAEARFAMELVARILLSVAEAAAHLHSLGISHGDLYAHNTLFNSDGHALLGDFGAATCYTLMQTRKDLIERLEVRAFGYLVDDLCRHAESNPEDRVLPILEQLKEQCLLPGVAMRPSFATITEVLREAF